MTNDTTMEQLVELGCDERDILFVEAYCRPDIRYNATAAYLEVYDTEKVQTARAAAARKMATPKIRKAVALYRDKRVLSNESLIKKVIGEMEVMAFTSPLTQLLSIKGKVRTTRAEDGSEVMEYTGNTIVVNSLDEVPPHVLAAVKSIKQTKVGIAVEFYDRARFMELLGRSLGMFTENLNVTEESYESFIARVTERARANDVSPDA